MARPISIRECVLIAIEAEKEKGQLPDDIKEVNEIAEVCILFTC